MGFKFRKSIKLGKGFRINLSKSGIGYSIGTKGLRYTKTATGKERTTVSIPGTGISYVSETGGKKRTTKQNTPKTANHFSAPGPENTDNEGTGNVWIKLIVCLFFGYLGVHKFMEKKNKMGFVYLFTMGLLGFGWLYDCAKYLIAAVKCTSSDQCAPIPQEESYVEDNPAYPPVEVPEKKGFSVKTALLWVLTVFLALYALGSLPHISGFLAIAAVAFVIPIEKWQNQIARFIKGKSKTIVATVMAVLALFSAPASDLPEGETADPGTAIMETTEETIPTTVEATPPAELEGISFDDEDYVIGVGRMVDIPFVLYPENAVISTLEASVDHAEIASLSFEKEEEHTVQITGLAPGEVTITLKSGESIVATKTITVVEVMPEGITITAKPQAPQIGASGTFTAAFDPLDVTDQDVIWQSDAPEVIRVYEDGSYEALSIGAATITATHKSGVFGTILIKVLPVEVTSVKLSSNWEEGKLFCKNDTMTLTAEVIPENATDKSITWTSSDESVATVSDEGVVKAIAHGTATITAKASNGKTGTYQITVDPSPQKFRVSASIQMTSNDHVGSNWTTGFEFNDEEIYSGSVVSITPGETFEVRGWAQDNDSKPDYGSYWERLTLTDEMCESGFTVEGEADVRENGGRYSGHYAYWQVKITFTPID